MLPGCDAVLEAPLTFSGHVDNGAGLHLQAPPSLSYRRGECPVESEEGFPAAWRADQRREAAAGDVVLQLPVRVRVRLDLNITLEIEPMPLRPILGFEIDG